jgi:hypothetical protein
LFFLPACVTPDTASAKKFFLKISLVIVVMSALTPREVLMKVVTGNFYFQLELNKLTEGSYGNLHGFL